MLGDTRSSLAYRSRDVWLLCSFQGPSEKDRGRHVTTVGSVRGAQSLKTQQHARSSGRGMRH